ncbi:Crp/Fnr family transcriptional regulator [Niabella ginsengisoli]|uniref:Crp/Fnr family transcriptional regulator n=1 Tax=Niabella ginsengisoli TaxID=522298 RepID=A0ABS9SN44_9BACT|nr:Crp/Fnr family transcriptional regulator [Niabella ginsengisoli]MCH5599763.1 Crp/Fnr family transcriptional regulator [Niabella ginsengisoli]
MDYELLIQSISNRVPINDNEKKLITALLKTRKLKKKNFLHQEGDIQQHVAFVKSGCLRSYSIDKNGTEHILQFAPAGWWIADMQSFLNVTPSGISIDAIEDSEAFLLNHTDVEQMYIAVPKMERYFRILAERSLATFQQRLIDALSLTAAERYTNFCKRYPTLIQTLPQKYIASYIGITPEFMSKMLSQPMKKG